LFLKTDGAGNLSFNSDLPTTSFTGATVETSIADSDLVLIYDDSATAVRKMTKANLVAGIGGANTPAFSAYLGSSQTFTKGVETTVQINLENFDTDSCYNTTTYKFTPNVAGKYLLYAKTSIYMTDAGWSDHAVFVWLNDTTAIGGNRIRLSGDNLNINNAQSFAISAIATANGTTDFFTLKVNCNGSGSSPTLDNNTSFTTYFAGFKLIGV
jgi:hypothetical protein